MNAPTMEFAAMFGILAFVIAAGVAESINRRKVKCSKRLGKYCNHSECRARDEV